ncbi:hypothetical protein Cni_G18033 [Canna indica]|uniref:Cyclin-dependent protein kinase inhibitor SMR4 n=1 Tax=Canna indica TaxID=4628 RepID=A0AAQ3KIH2_9LILI|nr:hypothetical protein Cni_G18033 [Canna indica]
MDVEIEMMGLRKMAVTERREEDAAMGAGGWETPRRAECRIPAAPIRCPPPPRKKSPALASGKRRDPPKNGYFHPPDLELLFAMAPRREACA